MKKIIKFFWLKTTYLYFIIISFLKNILVIMGFERKDIAKIFITLFIGAAGFYLTSEVERYFLISVKENYRKKYKVIEMDKIFEISFFIENSG